MLGDKKNYYQRRYKTRVKLLVRRITDRTKQQQQQNEKICAYRCKFILVCELSKAMNKSYKISINKKLKLANFTKVNS